MSDHDQIIPVESTPLGIPMMPIEQLKKLTAYVSEVKKALMVEGKDYVKDGNRQYTARSGFAKLHQGFFLSDAKAEIVKLFEKEPVDYTFKHKVRGEWKTEQFTTDIMGFEAYVTVINVETGRHASGEGACTIAELGMTNNLSPKWYHRALGTAKTRAWNRAVSNYVGSAEVSAEEMGLRYEDETPVRRVPVKVKEVEPSSTEEARDVNVADFMKPAELRVPETALADELNRAEDSWDNAVLLTENWMMMANINANDFVVSVDAVKITVKPKKRVPDEMMPTLETVMQSGGFLPTRGKTKTWRLNKAEVVD